MAITDKIRALLKLKGKSNKELAEYLGVSVQALSNKFYRDSYSGKELIKIAIFLDCEIAFISGETKINLNTNDL